MGSAGQREGQGTECRAAVCHAHPGYHDVVVQALRMAHEDAMKAREAAAAVDKQYKHLRRQYDLDKAKLEMEVGAVREGGWWGSSCRGLL